MNINKIKSIVSVAIFRGFGAFSVLILYFVSARLYPDSETARLAFVITLSSLLSPILLTGLHTFVLKRVAAQPEIEIGLLSETVRIFFRYSVPLTVVAIAVSFWWTDKSSWLFLGLLTVSLSLFNPLSLMIGSILQAKKHYNKAICVMNINIITMCVILIIFFRVALDGYFTKSHEIYLIYSIASFCNVIIAALMLPGTSRKFLSRKGNYEKFVFTPKDTAERYWLFLVMALLSVGNWSPQIAYYIIGAGADYAYFSAAERLANAINFFVIISNFYLAPIAASSFRDGDMTQLKASYNSITRVVFIVALPVATVLIFFPRTVLSFFGEQFTNGAAYLAIMAAAQLINVSFGSIKTILNMADAEKSLVFSVLIALILQILTIALSIQHIGGLAFAIAYAVNLLTQNALAAWFGWKHYGINVFSVFLVSRR